MKNLLVLTFIFLIINFKVYGQEGIDYYSGQISFKDYSLNQTQDNSSEDLKNLYKEVSFDDSSTNINNSHKNQEGVSVVESDSLALVAIYNANNGENWLITDKWLEGPVSSWHGITLDDSGYVISIMLSCNLTGRIPPEIGNFSKLELLDLENNKLSGSIPSEIGKLSNLTHFFIAHNSISGSIPKEIGNLSKLVRLSLWDNQLSGTFPPELEKLLNLEFLAIDQNKLEGTVPRNLDKLVSLKYLWLGSNEFTGSIPDEIGQMTQLEVLYLDDLDLTGVIPASFKNLTNLRLLNLGNNNLQGSIPVGIGSLINLENLNLENNQLSGSVPDGFGNFINLENLYMNDNLFSGSLPSGFNNLTKLKRFKINSNSLTELADLSSLGSLETISLENNFLTFEDLINTGKEFSSIKYYYYKPQGKLKLKKSLFYLDLNDQISLNIKDIIKDNLWSESNEFSIFKDGILVQDWSFDSIYEIASFSNDDEGLYYFLIRNSLYPNLVLVSEKCKLTLDENYIPSDIVLDNNEVAEGEMIGTVVGTFETIDEGEENTHNYTLIPGDGSNDADNDVFIIEDNILKTNLSLDYETKSEYFIYVQTEDAGGLFFEKAFKIVVTDKDETNIEINSENHEISVYPNPTNGLVYINLDKITGNVKVTIYNLMGKCIYQQKVGIGESFLDLSDISKGTFFLKINSDKETYSKIIIIQ
jgi:Leucine-rich repeat (LRR) protein